MKVTRSSTLLLSIVAISLISSSSAFLPPGSKVAHIPPNSFASNSQTSHINDGKANNKTSPDYFALLTFGVFLTNYNFTTAWLNANGSGAIQNECIKSSSDEGKATSLYCNLTTASVTKDVNTSQIIHLYLNESEECSFDTQTSKILFTGVPTLINTTNTSSNKLNTKCTAEVSYEFTNVATNHPFDHTYDSTSDLAIKVKISKGDCKIDYETPTLAVNSKGSKSSDIYSYIFIMAGMAILQSAACGGLLRSIDRNHTLAKRTSLGTICFFITFDFYIYLLHFSYWTTVSNWMAVVFILYFILSVFFEPALLYFVFSTLQNRANISIMALLSQLYIWLLVCGACLVITQTWIPNFLFYAFPFFLIPQIIDNLVTGTKYRWNYWLLLGIGLPKIGYLAYLSMNLIRIFRSHFSANTIYYGVSILVLEFIVLAIQTKWPTLGLNIFRKENYSYQCNMSELATMPNVVCSICTEHVKQTPLIGNQQPLMEQVENEDIMKTPCQHYFHAMCLKEWFKKKFECPNCRQRVPELLMDDD